MLELYKFDAGEYLSNSMQKIEFQYDTNILFQQFNASRRQKILKHMMKEIISLIYTLSDPEIIIPEEYGAKVIIYYLITLD